MDVVRVQHWVMSALALTVATLFASFLTVLGVTGEDKNGSRVGLLLIASVVGLIAMAGVRVINDKSWRTPWLLIGLLPAAVGAWWLWLR